MASATFIGSMLIAFNVGSSVMFIRSFLSSVRLSTDYPRGVESRWAVIPPTLSSVQDLACPPTCQPGLCGGIAPVPPGGGVGRRWTSGSGGVQVTSMPPSRGAFVMALSLALIRVQRVGQTRSWATPEPLQCEHGRVR
jgi:hypothetical protein